jgi:hypothetical protein
MRILFTLTILLALASCGQTSKKQFDEYTGSYKTIDQESCPIVLSIFSQKDELHYKITTSSRELVGQLVIIKQDNEVSLRFVDLLGDNPKDEVSGLFNNDTIVIQNYGNAMNQYIVFSECGTKYIELVRSEK